MSEVTLESIIARIVPDMPALSPIVIDANDATLSAVFFSVSSDGGDVAEWAKAGKPHPVQEDDKGNIRLVSDQATKVMVIDNG